MIRHVNYIIYFWVGLVLCSCNNNDTPQLEIEHSIAQNYIPESIAFKKNDNEFIEKIKPLVNKDFIVNSVDQLPVDPIGFSEAYNHINFKEYSLLISYVVHDWKIDTYRNRFYFNTAEQTYYWNYLIGTSSPTGTTSESPTFTRFAILVKKLPSDVNIKFYLSLGSLSWEWD